MRGARDSVLAFALLHSMFNRSNNPDGVAASVLSGQAYQVGILAVLVVLTITVALILRRRLGSGARDWPQRLPARTLQPGL
jgi:lipoprotein signal peptidase